MADTTVNGSDLFDLVIDVRKCQVRRLAEISASARTHELSGRIGAIRLRAWRVGNIPPKCRSLLRPTCRLLPAEAREAEFKNLADQVWADVDSDTGISGSLLGNDVPLDHRVVDGVEIEAVLDVTPVLRRGPEIAAEGRSRVGGDSAPLIHN